MTGLEVGALGRAESINKIVLCPEFPPEFPPRISTRISTQEATREVRFLVTVDCDLRCEDGGARWKQIYNASRRKAEDIQLPCQVFGRVLWGKLDWQPRKRQSKGSAPVRQLCRHDSLIASG